jgi:hypothetical protein
MFISKREAEERLAEQRNIFRTPHADAPPDTERVDEASVERESDDGVDESIQQKNLEHQGGKISGGPEASCALDSGPSLAHLDALLSPRVNGRATYQGKPESQAAIAETNLILGNSTTRRLFGLSEEQTYAYSKGLRSTADITNNVPPNPQLSNRINKIKSELAELAASRLASTLDALSPKKISEIKRATNLSKVAKDMAVILDKCTDNKEESRNVHFHVFVPDAADISKYPTIDVGPSLPSKEPSV